MVSDDATELRETGTDDALEPASTEERAVAIDDLKAMRSMCIYLREETKQVHPETIDDLKALRDMSVYLREEAKRLLPGAVEAITGVQAKFETEIARLQAAGPSNASTKSRH